MTSSPGWCYRQHNLLESTATPGADCLMVIVGIVYRI
jgi:hypothetical protein